MAMNMWDERYAGEEYHFGTEPNAFLLSQRNLFKPGMNCLALADGEGRNGVWLAEQGLHVLSVDSSRVALAKAKNWPSCAVWAWSSNWWIWPDGHGEKTSSM